jgi:hypothetical protein
MPYVRRMENNRITKVVIAYNPRGEDGLGRPLKRCHVTVTGHMAYSSI